MYKDSPLYLAFRADSEGEDAIGFTTEAEAVKFCARRPQYRVMRTQGQHTAATATAEGL